MTTMAEKAAVVDTVAAEAAPEKVAAQRTMSVPDQTNVGAPDKRRALGRGLESLLPSGPRTGSGVMAPPRPIPGNSSGLASGSFTATSASSAAVSAPPGPGSATSGAAAGAAGVAPHPIPTAGHSAVIAELQAQAARRAEHSVIDLPLDQVDSNPYQTRSRVSEEELAELATSILTSGVIQPIVVRPGKDGRYLLITGARRLEASKIAKKEKIPAIVRHVSDQQAAEMTIVENLQRQDLNCLDQAEAFARLSREFKLTQEEIGKRVGCSRETVSNYMRLLKLPGEVRHMITMGQLDFSLARELLTLERPEHVIKVAKEAVAKHLSVELLERLILNLKYPVTSEGGQQPAHRGARWVDPNVRAAQRELEAILGVRVKIRDRNGKGKITIEYSTLEDFDRVVGMLKGKK